MLSWKFPHSQVPPQRFKLKSHVSMFPLCLCSLNDLGLEKFSLALLFTRIFIPSSFLLVCILHLHYFHNRFLELTNLQAVVAKEESTIYRWGTTCLLSFVQAIVENLLFLCLAWFTFTCELQKKCILWNQFGIKNKKNFGTVSQHPFWTCSCSRNEVHFASSSSQVVVLYVKASVNKLIKF